MDRAREHVNSLHLSDLPDDLDIRLWVFPHEAQAPPMDTTLERVRDTPEWFHNFERFVEYPPRARPFRRR